MTHLYRFLRIDNCPYLKLADIHADPNRMSNFLQGKASLSHQGLEGEILSISNKIWALFELESSIMVLF